MHIVGDAMTDGVSRKPGACQLRARYGRDAPAGAAIAVAKKKTDRIDAGEIVPVR
jgi:hypothetical protein